MVSICSKLLVFVLVSFLAVPVIAQKSPQTIVGLATAQHFQSKRNGHFYIQLGVFSKKKNASRLEKKIRLKTKYPLHVEQKRGRYIVSIGPIKSAAEVRAESHQLTPLLLVSHIVKIQQLPVRANSVIIKQKTTQTHQPWLVTASLGYTNYQNMDQTTGETMLGRLAFGKEFFTTGALNFGMELGIQNGTSMQLRASEEDFNVLGSLPIQTTVKPVVDVLATVSTMSLGRSTLFGQLKGGVAYRSWQFENRSSINNLSQIAGEIQAGLGLPLSEKTKLSLLYQGIFGANPKLSVDTIAETGHVSAIPIQQGLLLSLSLTF